MILSCPQCATRFRLDDAKVKASGVKVRCSRCAHVFTAKPKEGGEPALDPEQNTSTRRVDAATLIALALESSPSPEPSATTHEIPVGGPRSAEDAELFADREMPASRSRDIDDFAHVFGAQGAEDPFDQLDAAPEAGLAGLHAGAATRGAVRGPPPSSLSAGGPPPTPPASADLFAPGLGARSSAGVLDDAALGESALSQLDPPSMDLPAVAPMTSSFLDPGGHHPSQDLGFREAMEEDFLGSRSSAAPVPTAPTAFSPFEVSDAAITPNLGGGDMGLFAPTSGIPVARLGLTSHDEHTRVAQTDSLGTTRTRSLHRRAIARWPTWLGLGLGLVVSSTFVPDWAPDPLGRIAPAVSDLLHPAARPRLLDALTDVRSENAAAFPYQIDDEVVVVVRGDAVHVGRTPRASVFVNVLMLDGGREVGRLRAPIGDAPDPIELRRRLAGGALPKRAPVDLAPGERQPFLLVFRRPGKEATRYRFRVEFTSGASERDDPGDPS